jgi:hypothetical protein
MPQSTGRLDLVAHGGLVARQIAGQLIELCRDHPPDTGNQQEGKKNNADHRHAARDMPLLQQAYGRREHEAQQDRQRDRDEDLAAEVEHPDNDRHKDGRRGTAYRRDDVIGITRCLEHEPVLWALSGFRGTRDNGLRGSGFRGCASTRSSRRRMNGHVAPPDVQRRLQVVGFRTWKKVLDRRAL